MRSEGRKDQGVDAETAGRTPYELVFEAAGFEDETFPAIKEEADARGVRVDSPGSFLLLGTVGRALRAFMPEAEPPQAGGVAGEGAAGRVLNEFGNLLYQAYNFWVYGERMLVLSTPLARHLVDDLPRPGEWELTPPHPAGYLQLPRRLFWVQVAPGTPPEPVDGLFWTMIGEGDPAEPPYGRLDLVVVSGLRPGRPGFGTLVVAAELMGVHQGHWAEADARPSGRDFASVLEGGAIQGLYSLTTTGEVLKLVSLCFWYVAAHPSAVVPVAAGARAARGGSPYNLPPSALPYDRLILQGTGELSSGG